MRGVGGITNSGNGSAHGGGHDQDGGEESNEAGDTKGNHCWMCLVVVGLFLKLLEEGAC